LETILADGTFRV